MKLTEKQKRFADEYLIDLNATRAYKAAYTSCKKEETARVNGSKLLTNTNVKAYIDDKIQQRAERTEVTQDMVVKELAKIGFANIKDFVAVEVVENGCIVKVKPTSQIAENKLGAIAGIKRGANGIEIKLNDKVRALELLGKHLGMFKDKDSSQGDNSGNIDQLIKSIEAARRFSHD
ncbi:MAG: terminase small subunit [bacterium]